MIRVRARQAVVQAGLRVPFVAAIALLGACGGDSPDDATPLDAGTEDAAPEDAGSDAPEAAAPEDAGADADAAPSTITATQIALGYRSSCALRENGRVTCWGAAFPTDVAAPSAATALTAIAAPATDHLCGLEADGTVHCWGGNSAGQSQPPAGLKLTRVSVSDVFSCGLAQDGALHCWGRQPTGIPTGAGYKELIASANGVCALQSSGEIACSTGEMAAPQGKFAQLVAFGANHCALNDMGVAVCWPNLNQVPADEHFSQVSLGTVRGCGVRDDGSATCWSNPSASRQQPPSGERFSSVQVGDTFACGIRRADQRVLCWGSSVDGATMVPLAD
jgi:alpha-tubulin suppressor-like RCC1 family protein